MTFRFGVISVSRSSSSSVFDIEDERVDDDADAIEREIGPGVVGMTHSSSVALGELALDDETSPLREGCFLRDFFAADRVFEEGVPILVGWW